MGVSGRVSEAGIQELQSNTMELPRGGLRTCNDVLIVGRSFQALYPSNVGGDKINHPEAQMRNKW